MSLLKHACVVRFAQDACIGLQVTVFSRPATVTLSACQALRARWLPEVLGVALSKTVYHGPHEKLF